MISDDDIEKAVEYITANARGGAQARAELVYVEEFRKVIKAQIMREYSTQAIGAQEAIAYSHPRYLQHLTAIKQATEADEYLRWMLKAAETKISAWQTQQRAQRGNL